MLALSCGRDAPEAGYAEAGRLNLPDDRWEPMAVAAAADGRVFVADGSFNNAIHIFAANGVYLGAVGGPGRAPGKLLVPTDVAGGPGGECYVADFGNKRLAVFGADGRFIKTLGEGVIRAPMGVAAAPDGELFVADAEAGLVVFAPDGHVRRLSTGDASGPIDVACSPDRRVALAAVNAGAVIILNKNGKRLGAVAPPDKRPCQIVEITFGPDRELFALGRRFSEHGAEEYYVWTFAPDGTPRGKINLPLTSPSGLAVSPAGTIYVADGSRHTVKVYKKRKSKSRA